MRRAAKPYFLAHWIVELVTLANAAFGFTAGVFLVKFVVERSVSASPPLGYLTLVWLFMFFGGIFDYLDGVVSRRMGISTEMGKELDSQCDGITFGIIPAMIILFLNASTGPLYWKIFVWLGAIAYLCCALFRLARFDVGALPGEKYHLKFTGMPTPTAAGMVGGFILLYVSLHDSSIIFVKMLWGIFSQSAVIHFSEYLITALPFLGLLLAWSMVSDLEFFHLNTALVFLKKCNPLVNIFCFLILLFLAILLREMAIFLLPLLFVLYGLAVPFLRKANILKQ